MTYDDGDHIDNIIDNFHFTKIVKFMKEFNWILGFDNRIPDEKELKLVALELLMGVVDKKIGYWISTGGLTATKCDDYLKLDFSIATTESCIINLTDTYKNDKKKKERKKKLEKLNGISSEEKK